jgi:putative ATPase
MAPSETASLFEAGGLADGVPRPLADRLRPNTLEQVVGQSHLLGPQAILTQMIEAGRLSSVIFWGPSGSGKTTIARLLAEHTNHHFEQISAIHSGVQELRKLFEAARTRRRDGLGSVLFVDEVHRFNRSQQDSFLPVMEDGTIVLIGATTENPAPACSHLTAWMEKRWKCCFAAPKRRRGEAFCLKGMFVMR